MYFENLYVNNFGPFLEFNITFHPLGINLISGRNASGKTQLIGSILFAIYGRNSIDFNEHEENESEVRLTLREGTYKQTIEHKVLFKKSLEKKQQPIIQTNISTFPSGSKEIDFKKQLIGSFVAKEEPNFIFTGREEINSSDIQRLGLITETIEDDREGFVFWNDLYDKINNQYHDIENDVTRNLASQGQIFILQIAHEFVKRKTTNNSIPLIIDDSFGMLDHMALRFVCKLIIDIAEKDQVLFLSPPSEELLRLLKRHITAHILLETLKKNDSSPIWYNYRYLDAIPHYIVKKRYSSSDLTIQRPTVFISYVRENSKQVDDVRKALEENGINVWLDKERITPGMRWKSEIRKAIREVNFFIACFSKESSNRVKTYMNKELFVAIEELQLIPRNKAWFISILLSECDIPDMPIGIGETLKDIQWVELYNDFEDGIEKITKIILDKQ